MLMDMCLPKFHIYQDTIAPNALKATKTLDVLILFTKRVLSHVRSEIHLVDVTSLLPDNRSELYKILFKPVAYILKATS